MAAITTTGSGSWSSTTANAPWPSGTVPGEGDTVTIANGHTVTIDQNVTVGADTTTAAINVASGGKLQVLSTVAGNYTLTLKGDLSITGTVEFGTTANPIPSTRTFTVLMNYSASLSDGEYGIIVNAGGTLTIQGASKTTRTTLSTSGVASDDHIHTADSTSWVSGDLIVIAPMAATAAQYEEFTLDEDASSTTVNLPSTLAYAHTIGSDRECEVMNLTRNIKISAYNTSYPGYLQLATTSTVDIDYVEFSYIGSNSTGKHGISVYTTTGSCNVQRCSFRRGEGYNIRTYDTSDNWTFSYNDLHYGATGFSYAGHAYLETKASPSSAVFSYNWGCYCSATSAYLFNIRNAGITLEYCRAFGESAAGGYGFYLYVCPPSVTGCIAHSCNTGYIHANGDNVTFTSIKSFKNADGWFTIYGVTAPTFVNCDFFDCTNYGFRSYGTSQYYSGLLTGCNFYGNGTGVYTNSGFGYYEFVDCTFGSPTANTSRDLYLANSNRIVIKQCEFNSTTKVAYYGAAFGLRCEISDSTIEGVWVRYGYWQPDTTLYRTSSPSIRGTPRDASNKVEIPVGRVAVPSGSAATVTCYARKSASGDGAAYNGNEPLLNVKRCDSGGITSDTTLDTMSGGEGSFAELSGTTAAVSANVVLEIILAIDGTAGWINIDDIAVTVA